MPKSLLKQLAADQKLSRDAAAVVDPSVPLPAPKASKRKARKPAGTVEKECDEITAFRWVAATLNANPRESTAPSKAAWNLHQAAQDDEDIRSEVWKKFMALGAKQDDNAGDRLGQTGRFSEKLLKELLAAVREEAYTL